MSAVLDRPYFAEENELLGRAVRSGSKTSISKPIVKYFIRGSGATGLFEETSKLNEILKQAMNWTDPDRDPPSVKAITSAKSWLQQFHDAAKADAGWETPHITSTECGEISFEWWNGHRKFSIFFTDDQVEFIKAWGYNIDTEMDSGELSTCEQFRVLWQWLGARGRA